MQPTTVLATLTGRDRPGVTASFFAALAAHDIEVLDVEQVVIRERLIMAVLVDLRGDIAALRNSVTRSGRALGLDCEVAIAEGGSPQHRDRARRSHVIIIGHPLRPGALSHVTQCFTDLDASIESITQLSSEPAASLEMIVRCKDQAALRAALVRAADETGLDIAVEQARLRRGAKRLVVLDLDSTLIRDPSASAIDALAERAGAGAEVAAITAQAKSGELDFAESLRARVSRLSGLTVGDLDQVRDSLELTPRARTFVRTLRRVGYYVGVVSGGFTFVTDRVVAELGLDFAAANRLEVADGVVTGSLVGPVLDRPGKAAALSSFATDYGVPMSQTVAVGEGSSDLAMLDRAGLAIAFNAKSALRNAADASVTLPYLDTVLFVLGISEDDVAEEPGPEPEPDPAGR